LKLALLYEHVVGRLCCRVPWDLRAMAAAAAVQMRAAIRMALIGIDIVDGN
jgi:hypothetical protein